MLTTQDLKKSYRSKNTLIKKRIDEFNLILETADDNRLFEELVFCILTAGTSASMWINVISHIKKTILSGTRNELRDNLKGIYRFYNIRSDYIHHTREYLLREHSFKLRELIESFSDNIERRDYIALNKDIRGIGFKEASHFLRNIGYKGYVILDKHIINSLHELEVIEERKVPSNRATYLDIEKKFKNYAVENGFDIDELDLLLWSEKTGTILK